MRRAPSLLIGLCLLSVPLARHAAADELKVGGVETATNRDGAWLREDPLPLAKKITRAPFRTRLKIIALREMWARVTTETEPAVTGWVRVSDMTEPGSLAGGAASAVSLGASEVSAAGRSFGGDAAAARQANDPSAGKQFDRKTESTFRTMDPKLDAAYALVEQVERSAPPDDVVEAFIREGRLGGTATAGTPNGQGSYAKLKFLGATGATEGVTIFEDAYTPLPPPASDEDFVQRLGVGLTVDQEYWLGRAVAAAAIAKYGLDPDEKRQTLVRKIGASIAMLSDRLRTTHGGYHFAVLDCPVANGISGPGGFVLLTRGAIELARNEDEIAGIVAHELAHVAYKHGEQMVRKTREFQDELKRLQARVDRGPTAGLDCNLCGEMARALGTAAKTIADTLNDQGYGKDYELAADWAGSLFLCEVGYRASAIAEYLEMLPTRAGTRWTTHPSSEERIEALRPLVFKHGCPFETDDGAQARLPRFKALASAPAPASSPAPAASAGPGGSVPPPSPVTASTSPK